MYTNPKELFLISWKGRDMSTMTTCGQNKKAVVIYVDANKDVCIKGSNNEAEKDDEVICSDIIS